MDAEPAARDTRTERPVNEEGSEGFSESERKFDPLEDSERFVNLDGVTIKQPPKKR